jgi:hypothetical protein
VVSDGEGCRSACPRACRRARTSPRLSTGAAALERRLLVPRAGAVPHCLARAHEGGRDWEGPHGGERRKTQRGHDGEEKKQEGRGKKKQGKMKEKKKEKKVREKGKNNLSIVLEIVIHNLYLLYYYRGMKIEYASYKQI